MTDSRLGKPLCEINLGIVSPMANESETAVAFVKEVLAQCESAGFKSIKFLVVLDQVSKDNTLQLMQGLARERAELRVVWAPENRNIVDAYVRGYREALAEGCDWILEIDAGFSHQPSDIPQFFTRMSEGYDCVFGSRFCENGKFEEGPKQRYLVSRGGTVLTNLVLGTKLKDMTSGFELFRRPVLEEVLARGIRSRGPFFQTEIKTYCRHLNTVEVPIRYRSPSHNLSNVSIQDAFANLWRLFRLRVTGRLRSPT
jgi:dolichol-phosphate mannosyltransferase